MGSEGALALPLDQLFAEPHLGPRAKLSTIDLNVEVAGDAGERFESARFVANCYYLIGCDGLSESAASGVVFSESRVLIQRGVGIVRHLC